MIQSILVSSLTLAMTQMADFQFVEDKDPGGCKLERIAVEEGIGSYQYDSISPDGKSIAIAWEKGENERGTYLLDLETGQKTNIPEFNNGVSFSPDGKWFVNSVYVEGGKTDILEINSETGEQRLIASHEASDWLPSYSPDGKYILFNSFRAGGSNIFLYDRKTEILEQLTDTPNYDAHAQFSPDGKMISFHRQVGRQDFNIILFDLETRTEKAITSSPREESYASWSHDGSHIFYSSDKDNEPENPDIMVMTKEGKELHKLTSHPSKDAYSFASPDGKYLYFMSYRNPQGVYRIPLNEDLTCEKAS